MHQAKWHIINIPIGLEHIPASKMPSKVLLYFNILFTYFLNSFTYLFYYNWVPKLLSSNSAWHGLLGNVVLRMIDTSEVSRKATNWLTVRASDVPAGMRFCALGFVCLLDTKRADSSCRPLPARPNFIYEACTNVNRPQNLCHLPVVVRPGSAGCKHVGCLYQGRWCEIG